MYLTTTAGDGYAGRTFPINVKDEGMVDLIGPWHTQASHVNALGFGPCMDISITEEAEVWERGHTFYASACTVGLIREICGQRGIHLIKSKLHDNKGGLQWTPSCEADKIVKPKTERKLDREKVGT